MATAHQRRRRATGRLAVHGAPPARDAGLPDFAEQLPDRRYQASGVLRPLTPSPASVGLLRQVALPRLHDLVDRVQESANLVVLAGTEARFVATVECARTLRVGSRVGHTLPAHLTSGGKALLAVMPPDEVTALYDGSDVDLPRLHHELTLVRKRGFAINNQRTEAGLIALGVAVRAGSNSPIAALAIAMPSVRFNHDQVPTWVSTLTATASAIEHDLCLEEGW